MSDVEVAVSSNGLLARINERYSGPYRSFDGNTFRRVVGDQPLRETTSTWTIRLSGPSGRFAFRIGVANGLQDVSLSPEIRISKSWMSLEVIPERFEDIVVDGKPEDVLFDVSADLKTGSLSATIRTPMRNAIADPWFSVSIPPAYLAEAVPTVYFYGTGSTAALVVVDN